MKKDKNFDREAKKYQNPIPSREYILDIVKQKSAIYSTKLVDILELTQTQKKVFTYRLKAMLRDEQLSVNHQGKLTIFSKDLGLKGQVIANPKGFGFVQLESGGKDLRLSPFQMQSVFHGETVFVRHSGDRNGAKIIDITNRISTIIGRLIIDKKGASLQADDRRIQQKIIVKSLTKEHKNNQIVIAKITQYPNKNQLTEVKINQVLGNYMAQGIEIKSALLRYQISNEFQSDTQKESNALPERVLAKDKKDRVNLTHLPLITIDGEDSKDFDDAVYAQKEGKHWKLWVAIADVSYYVKPNSPLDKEAQQRATSVYFANKVVPMLPEKLSNGLCSLNPKLTRLCLACELSINAKGEVLSKQFYPAVMKSYARMTYTQVSQILEHKDKTLIKKYQSIMPNILTLDALHDVLSQARKARGAMVFTRTQSQILFDDNGKIKDIIAKHSNKAHCIIEECMLLANQSCAQFLDEQEQSFLYRVHPKPSDIKLQNFIEFLTTLNIDGISILETKDITPKHFADILEKTNHREDSHLIQTMALRSMQQAVYTDNNDGHFGLAFEQYTHFTSPIRRYPDLLAHRAIKQALAKQKPSKATLAKVVKLGKHCSERERNADDATRDVEKWLKCEFMSHRINQTYNGVISGLANFGLFVELDDIYIDGLVSITALKDDYYTFNQNAQTFIGRDFHKIYTLGDSVKVKVSKVSLDQRQIELEIVLD